MKYESHTLDPYARLPIVKNFYTEAVVRTDTGMGQMTALSDVLIDSGSTGNLMPRTIAEACGLKVEEGKRVCKIEIANRDDMILRDCVAFYLTISRVKTPVRAWIMERATLYTLLLGRT